MTSPSENLLPPSHLTAAELSTHMRAGQQVTIAPGVVRLLAANPKPYTGPGTNSYIVGDDRVAVIDPGPDCRAHVERLMDLIDGRPVEGVFVTHSHLDHSPAARLLKEHLGAPVFGAGALPEPLLGATDEDIDPDFRPDVCVADGARFAIGDDTLTAVHTPGHFPNHLCLYLENRGILFSGDHVMGWSTTVVVPPLGHLGDYLESLDKLDHLGARLMLPSHGETVADPARRIAEIRQHRAARHAQVEAEVARGNQDPAEIVEAIYEPLPDRLVQAARGQVQAHLNLMAERTARLRRSA